MVSKKLQDKFYAALESLKDGKNDYILEALAAGAKATFEGVKYGYEWKFHTPGEEPLVSEFGTPDYFDHYDPNDRLSYAKNLAEKTKRFDEPNPRFGKPMIKKLKDGSYTSLTPMRSEWDSEYQRFGIPKAIRKRVDQLIAKNGWNIVLDKSGYAYDKQNTRHNEIPEKYVWNSETDDPAMIEEITRTLAPLGFKHDTESHEAHYGFTGHGPIDTETFSEDVWKYTDKPVSPVVAEAVTKLGNAISEMKTSDNAPMIESIMEGFVACFEGTQGLFDSDETEGGKRFHALDTCLKEIDDADLEKIKAGDYTEFIEKLRSQASPCGRCFRRPNGRWFTEESMKTDVLDVMNFNLKYDAERGHHGKCILDDPNEKAWFFDSYDRNGNPRPWAVYFKWLR